MDLYPTLLDLAGAPVPTTVAGRSLVNLLQGRGESEPAFSELPKSAYAVRSGGWKYIKFSDGHSELYDLRADPHEHHDVAQSESSRTAAMARLLGRHLADAIKRGERIDQQLLSIDGAILEQLRSLGYVQQ